MLKITMEKERELSKVHHKKMKTKYLINKIHL
jgi:hypothetical protein